MTHTNVEHNVDFIEQHERAVVKQALQAVAALHDALCPETGNQASSAGRDQRCHP